MIYLAYLLVIADSIYFLKFFCVSITDAWGEGVGSESPFPILSCINSCRARLYVWNQTEFGHLGKQISQLQKHLEWL